MTNRIENEILHGEKISQNAEEIWGWSSPAGLKRADRRAQYFIQYGELAPDQHILEIGCGTGVFTEKIAKTGVKITAIDLSRDLLKQAREKNIPNCSFEEADAHHLKYENEQFDVVLGSSILHHLEVPVVLAEIFRVLKPGGHFVFAEPNMLNPQILLQKNIPWIKKKLGDSPDETAFIRWSIANELKKTGFKESRVFPYDFLHPLTPPFLIHTVDQIGRFIERTPLLREIAGSLVITAIK